MRTYILCVVEAYTQKINIYYACVYVCCVCAGCFSIKVVKALMGIEWNVLTEKFEETVLHENT